MSTAAVTAEYASITVRTAATTRAVTASKVTDRLHPAVIAIGVAAYAALMATLILGFAGASDFMVPVLILLVCLTAFIAVPAWMGASAAKFWQRHGGREARIGSFREFLRGRFENDGGTSTGLGALALVTTVPISLSLGAVAMVIILNVIK